MAAPAGGVFAIAKAFSFGRVQHLFDSAPHSRGGFGLDRPDRLQRRKYVVGADSVYRLGAKGGSIVLQRRFPLRLMLLIAKALRKRLAYLVSYFAERRNAALPLALIDWVDPLGNLPARRGGVLTGIGERHACGASEPHLLGLASKCKAQHPFPGTSFGDN